jgi:hypothetical protein
VTFYTWTADQFSQYGTKVIPATVRDATYVLDEILDNETELPILEHTTDTAGYTEIVFAQFDLLGLQFSPRIRDLGDEIVPPGPPEATSPPRASDAWADQPRSAVRQPGRAAEETRGKRADNIPFNPLAGPVGRGSGFPGPGQTHLPG